MINTREITIIGNVGQEPKFGTTQNGRDYLMFSVANYEGYKDKTTGERIDKSEWTSCTVWGEQAGRLNGMLKKGMKVLVKGKPYADGYVDKQSGQNVYKVTCTVTDVMFLSKADQENAQDYQTTPRHIPGADVTSNVNTSTTSDESEDSDDLPF